MLMIQINSTEFINAEIIALVAKTPANLHLLTKNGKSYIIDSLPLVRQAIEKLGV